MTKIANTPRTPYYAVIFTSIKSENLDGYEEVSERMLELAAEEEGFLGIESAQSELGITVSYWRTLEDIARWKNNAEHKLAQSKGYEIWYRAFATRVAKVERDNVFTTS